MIRSMTGFGRTAFSVEGISFVVEARSVNHRYLDVRVRLPRMLSDFESEIKTRIRARLQRGKLDLSLAIEAGAESSPRVSVDRHAALQYLGAARDLAGEQGVSGELNPASLLALPGVARFIDPELTRESVAGALRKAVDSALEVLDQMRVSEGEALTREFEERFDSILARVANLDERSELVQRSAREKLRKRAQQLRQETGILDEARLHQEIVFAADRMDISEELVRLKSHVAQFRKIVSDAAADVPSGRRLDFLTQEMAREANTIGSKGSDAPISHQVVELKAEIERVREQVQNIE